jgi:hypothetical protein
MRRVTIISSLANGQTTPAGNERTQTAAFCRLVRSSTIESAAVRRDRSWLPLAPTGSSIRTPLHHALTVHCSTVTLHCSVLPRAGGGAGHTGVGDADSRHTEELAASGAEIAVVCATWHTVTQRSPRSASAREQSSEKPPTAEKIQMHRLVVMERLQQRTPAKTKETRAQQNKHVERHALEERDGGSGEGGGRAKGNAGRVRAHRAHARAHATDNAGKLGRPRARAERMCWAGGGRQYCPSNGALRCPWQA